MLRNYQIFFIKFEVVFKYLGKISKQIPLQVRTCLQMYRFFYLYFFLQILTIQKTAVVDILIPLHHFQALTHIQKSICILATGMITTYF